MFYRRAFTYSVNNARSRNGSLVTLCALLKRRLYLLIKYYFILGATYITNVQTFGQGTGPILFNYIRCIGTESRLIDCPSRSSRSCAHSQDVGVRCLMREGNLIT